MRSNRSNADCRLDVCWLLVVTVLSGMAVWAGCSAAESASPPIGTPTKPASSSAASGQLAATEKPAVAKPSSLRAKVGSERALRPLPDAWFAIFVKGTKIGYEKVVTTSLIEHGQSLRQVTDEVHLSVSRNGQPSEQRVVSTDIETPAGQLLRFRSEMDAGSQPVVTTGEVRDGDMCLTTTSAGAVRQSLMPWQSQVGGFKATEQSLAGRPMKPGETRQFKEFTAGFNDVANVELVGEKLESTRLIADSAELLRIRWTAKLPKDQAIHGIMWIDGNGDVVKTEVEGLGQTAIRTTQAIATSPSTAPRFDLLLSTIVPVNRPLPNPSSTRAVCYRVHLENADPACVFAECMLQQIRRIDGHTAEIAVCAARPFQLANVEFSDSPVTNDAFDEAMESADWGGIPLHGNAPPTDGDRRANSLIQSDSPRIRELARQAAGNETDRWKTAAALEKFTHDYITGRDYSKSFSTAEEVAESRTGACTQHAVLLAALARARGIPARVAIGLVYTRSSPGFAVHMWDEVWIDSVGHWVPLDATRGEEGVGADRLKLTDSNLAAEDAYDCFLPVANVIGQAKIEILRVR